MLYTYPGEAAAGPSREDRGALIWVDLLDPSPSEAAFVENATGLRLPSREDLSEIESSSRHFVESGSIYLSTPLLAHATAEDPQLTPVGFILAPHVLVTIRFSKLSSFDNVRAQVEANGPAEAVEVFTLVVEAVVDRIADVMELTAAELDRVSHRAFHLDDRRRTQLGRANEALRRTLQRLGRTGDRVSELRDALLGVGRIVPFVAETGKEWISPALARRLEVVRQDIASLSDYQTHLTGKVQFLLDAVLGFINTEQNDIIKILTIVSVVGVPPTLVASIYGMNFKAMPELNWAWGYPYALALIVATTLGPLLWFKIRGWF